MKKDKAQKKLNHLIAKHPVIEEVIKERLEKELKKQEDDFKKELSAQPNKDKPSPKKKQTPKKK